MALLAFLVGALLAGEAEALRGKTEAAIPVVLAALAARMAAVVVVGGVQAAQTTEDAALVAHCE
jgi:hypothetical protein